MNTQKQILLKEIKDYFKHQVIYNPTIIKNKYGFKNEQSVIDLVDRLTFKI